MPNSKRVLNLQGAIQEAGRCLLCHDAPCNTGCGADTDPATFILKLRMGNIKGAVRTMRRNNILAAACAQVCPTCRLCGEGCSRSALDEPIKISKIQAFLADYECQEEMQVLQAPSPGNRKIAVIGSGPAGLSAAANLAMQGYAVTVFEKQAEPGGLLRYGIPDHRLNRDILTHEINLIRNLGVQFVCGKPIADRNELESLLHDGFDAIFIATGYDQPYGLGLPNEDLSGVLNWVEFLRRSKGSDTRRDLETAVTNKRIVVVGGGSVAMDCAVTAKNLGATRVDAISLESITELPADMEEKELAFHKGIRFKSNSRLTDIQGDDGKLTGVHGLETRWIKPGCFVPENAVDIPGTEFSLPADILILAIGAGFSPDFKTMLSGLENENGRPVTAAQTMQTSDPRIFAGGDMVAAGKTVATSVRDGKKAAEAIAQAFPLSSPAIVPKKVRPSLEIEFCGSRFLNPFCLSASPVANTAQMVARAFDAGWGGVVYKTLNIERDYKIIDPTPRLNALHHGDRRFIGLQNIEMVSERPLDQNLKDIAWLKKRYPDRILISSIMGYSDAGWIELAKGSEDAGADMLELNFSCPQMAIEGAGHTIGQDYQALEHFTLVVKDCVSIPVIAKMTPNITDMLPPSLAAKQGGADAISAINTLRAISEVDLDTFAPMPTIQGKGSISGYSGPAVKPIALRFVAELSQSQELSLPVSGIGGLETWQDAVMFLLMGASNLQITTAVMRYGYRIIESLCEGLEDYLESKGLNSVQELVGRGLPYLVDPSEHHQTRHVISVVDADTCIGCGLCHVVCHDGANQAMNLDPVTRKATTDEERCVGCLLCKHVCPVWDCISIKEIDGINVGGMHNDALGYVEG
ncbi:NAD-dependent dihydropyrimidine dehydrogenase subunit PreA [bacterium]|nr:NAD-dependent dihydropyrimidine dehydrogenase subunit PreA [bacterium]